MAYVLDFAELPSAEELARLDADRDGRVLPSEREAYLDQLFSSLKAQWRWSVDGEPVEPRVLARSLEVSTGEGNLQTLRVIAELRVDRPSGSNDTTAFELAVRDESYANRPGWRELRAEQTAATQVDVLSGAADPDVLARRAQGERVTLRMNEARWRVSVVRPALPSRRAPASSAGRTPAYAVLAAVVALLLTVAIARRLRAQR